MKARIKATGKIVEVEGTCLINGGSTYIPASELESFVEETPIDWEQRRFELTKAAMQGMLSNPSYDVFDNGFSNANTQLIVLSSIEHADESVKQLKGGQP